MRGAWWFETGLRYALSLLTTNGTGTLSFELYGTSWLKSVSAASFKPRHTRTA